MPSGKTSDDVIRIRIDTAWPVGEFLRLLAAQAAEGETRAPANPGNRAVFRELAPFRLVEYGYVPPNFDCITNVFVGFPGGGVYAVADDIPEADVDDLIKGQVQDFEPLYLYVVLDQAQPPVLIHQFLTALADHMGHGLVGVFRDHDGAMSAHSYGGGPEDQTRLKGWVARSMIEADRHLSRQRVLDRYAARICGAQGQAWAQFTHRFAKWVVEFPSMADRDDFIRWTRTLCQWQGDERAGWDDVAQLARPAETAPAPKGEVISVSAMAPAKFHDGTPWQAFDGEGSPQKAREYWGAVTGAGRA